MDGVHWLGGIGLEAAPIESGCIGVNPAILVLMFEETSMSIGKFVTMFTCAHAGTVVGGISVDWAVMVACESE